MHLRKFQIKTKLLLKREIFDELCRGEMKCVGWQEGRVEVPSDSPGALLRSGLGRAGLSMQRTSWSRG